MGEILEFILSGFGVVLGALALLWLISAMIGRVFTLSRPASKPASTPAAAPQPSAPGIPPAHVAAISAAVAMITSGRGRIISVHAPAHTSYAWAHDGRTDQLGSHRVHGNWARPHPAHAETLTPSNETASSPDDGKRRP